jgi:non-heme Fe2+,alpha-ketoglutarate-dependent halogenase
VSSNANSRDTHGPQRGDAFMLSTNEVQQFNHDGFIGPYDALGFEELSVLRNKFESILANDSYSPLYQRKSGRDWHLIAPELLNIIKHSEIVERLKCLLSPNLMLWRSQLFHKAPGDGPLHWHQALLFSGEEYGREKHSLIPPEKSRDYSDWFDITVWVAIDDATADNGAVALAKGTHRTRYPIVKVPFLESAFGHMVGANLERTKDIARLEHLRQLKANQSTFDPIPEQSEIHLMEMKAGQFFIFNERTMHSSGRNVSQRRRLGMNFRITTPDVVVYPFRRDGDFLDGEDYDISRHGCILLSGEDHFKENVMFSNNYTFCAGNVDTGAPSDHLAPTAARTT